MAVDYTTGFPWYDANKQRVKHDFPKGTVAKRDEILELCKESIKLVIAKNKLLPHQPGGIAHFKKYYKDHVIDLSYDSGPISEIHGCMACITLRNYPWNYSVNIGEFYTYYSSKQPKYEESEEENNPPTNNDIEMMLEKLYSSLKEIYKELSNN